MKLYILLIIFVITFTLLFIIWCTCSGKGQHFIASIKYKKLKIPISQSLGKSHMNALHSILTNCQIPFFLTEGTALGAIREQRVIPHDTDIDIGIDISYYKKFKTCALPAFKSLGFKTSRDIQKKNNTSVLLTIIKNYLYIDIMFLHKDGHCIDIPCKKMREYLNNKIEVEMYGKKHWSLPITYLEDVYGKNWRIPARLKPKDIKK